MSTQKHRKGLINIIYITQDEARQLRALFPAIRIPKTKNGKYYVEESRAVVRHLRRIRGNTIDKKR